MLRGIAQTLARSSPAIHRIGGGRVLQGIETFTAFVAGKGSGSGWDIENETKSVALLVRVPAVIFDVGANDGRWSARLERVLQNRDNRYFLFEPAVYCLEGLNKAQLPNATILSFAVSDRDGSKALYVSTQASGLASLHERRDVSVLQYDYEKIEVVTRSLDSIASEYGINSIDLLKMDIEGHELSALHGAARLLSQRAIKALTFEFGSANVNSRTFFRDFWDLLTANGFKIYRVIPGGGLTEVRRYSEDLEYFRGATNYAAKLN